MTIIRVFSLEYPNSGEIGYGWETEENGLNICQTIIGVAREVRNFCRYKLFVYNTSCGVFFQPSCDIKIQRVGPNILKCIPLSSQEQKDFWHYFQKEGLGLK